MPAFISIPINVDAGQAEQDFYDLMEATFPGWTPAEGNLEVWIAKWAAQMRTDLAGVAADVPAEIFYQFGVKLLQFAPIAPAAASGPTTWVVANAAGYTIPAGTLVGIPISGDQVAAFAVADDVVIPAGATTTDVGQVLIVASIEGEAGNGLTGTPALIDALPFVASITLESATSGGVDAEDANAYLNRLAGLLHLFTPRPVLASDAADLARALVPGVTRAVAIDNYNPADDTYDNERMVAVFAIDEAGLAVSGPVKAKIDALLQSTRESDFIFNVADPTYTQIDVSVTFVPYTGFDSSSVIAAIEAAISDYLSPANWGKGLSADQAAWRNVTVVRRLELVALVNNVTGVDYVTALTLAEHGDPLATADVTLNGPAPLPIPNTITATT